MCKKKILKLLKTDKNAKLQTLRENEMKYRMYKTN